MSCSTIRTTLRAKRRALSPQQQIHCASQILARLRTQYFFIRARRVGLYLPNDGEADTRPIIDLCRQYGKQCFLPVIHPMKNRLHFVGYGRHTALSVNKYGILEPSLRSSKPIPTWSLDLILMPLVGFDRRGNRLGMGGGYYDRTLAFVDKIKRPSPRLVGLAHSCQEVAAIPSRSWDVAVENVITDREILCVKQK